MGNQNRGFSLIEVMVSVGISCIVIFGMIMVTRNLTQTNRTAETSQELTSLMYEVNGILNNDILCTGALTGALSVNGQDVSVSTGIGGGKRYGKLDIQSIKLQNVTVISAPNYIAEVEIRGSRVGEVYGSRDFIKKARVFYSVNGTNHIVSCISAATDASANCLALGGQWNGSYCSFCESMGGTVLADGSCQLSGATVYMWQPGAWSVCGSGSQSRVVQCVDSVTAAVTADAMCVQPKPAQTQTCATYDWQVGAWGACSAGSQTRPVTCIDTFTHVVAADSSCSTAKPANSQGCATYDWLIGSWGTCSGGTSTRTVNCRDTTSGAVVADGNCTTTKPSATQSCGSSCKSPGTSLGNGPTCTSVFSLVIFGESECCSGTGRYRCTAIGVPETRKCAALADNGQ